jgi:hypothetical protein
MHRSLYTTMSLLSFLFGSCSKKSDRTVIDIDVKKEDGVIENQAPKLQKSLSSRFHPGQVWEFTPPVGQPNARITILRVEEGAKSGKFVHIAISGVNYGDGHSSIPHLPFSEDAISKSVTKLERDTGPVPEYEEGYNQWREAFDSGKGGVFTIGVAEAYEAVTGALPKKK